VTIVTVATSVKLIWALVWYGINMACAETALPAEMLSNFYEAAKIKCPIEVGKRGCSSKVIFKTHRWNTRNNKASKIEAKT